MKRLPPPVLFIAMALMLSSSRIASGATTKTVSSNGHADFTTIQAAIDSVPARNAAPVVIEIAPGHYDERLLVAKNKPFITLRGMGNMPADVWIGGALPGQGAILTAEGDDMRCEHLTLEDQSIIRDEQTRSAIMMYGQRQVIEDCAITGKHNTLYVHLAATAYIHGSSITGTGDIVFGGGTAFLDNCDVYVIERGGVIAAPNTPRNVPVGLAFVDCRFVAPPSATPGLMRPWGPDGATAFIRCSMDPRISRQGWISWDGREATCRAEEFGSTTPDGKPLDMSGRPSWVRRISAEEAARYTLVSVYPAWSVLSNERK